MAKKPFEKGYDLVQGTMEIWQDPETGTVYVGPYQGDKGEFDLQAFIRQTYPDANIVFETPWATRNLRAQERVQKKTDLQARVAEIEATLQKIKHTRSAGQAMVLIREKEGLLKKIAGM